jgi:hypothetical protein
VFFVVGAILAGAFMLGSSTPVFTLYHSLPLGNLFRAPRRMDFLYVFLFSVIIGIGLQALKERLHGLAGRGFVSTVVTLACVGVIGVEAYSRIHLPFTHPFLGEFVDHAPAELTGYMRRQTEHQRFFLERNQGIWAPRPSIKTGMMNELFVVPDYEASMPQAYEDYFSLPESRSPWHGQLSVLPRARHQPPELLGRLLDLMSVRFYAMWRPIWPAPAKELEFFAGGKRISVGPVEVVERPTALPRVYTVREARYEADVDSALDRIGTEAFRPRDEAVVVSPIRETVHSDSDASQPDVARIAEYSAEEVSIAAECHSACLLVLTDLYYPGWRVFVDGREDEIKRVNVLFRGVWLDSGKHQIVYRYEPTSFRLGLWMLLAAILTSVVLIFADRPRAFRSQRHAN